MEFGWSDTELAFRARLRRFIDERLPAEWALLIPGEHVATDFTMSFSAALADAGLFASHWPHEYGGNDASPWQFIVSGEELWAAGEPRGSQYMNVNWIGPAIFTSGTDEQKDLHLKRIAGGDVTWCQGFSETGAGTDLAALSTTAERDGDSYVINGQKVWTSYAQDAEYCFVLARTDPQSSGTAGISIFLVPTSTPGFRREVIPSVLEIHEYNRLTFADVRVPESCRLGAENEGWAVIRSALAHERIGGPRYARAALVTERIAAQAEAEGWWGQDGFGMRLAAARSACAAARILVYQAIDARVKGRPEDLVVSLARVAIVRCERAVAELAADLGGEESLVAGSVGHGQLKTAMIAGLGGGSVEVQLNQIARIRLGSGR
ncbi:acyl-CoA dehydrogenase family protein [uncultured Jatrophihabitans sp.]|uniref:acyl-CoA dehydrogenase family protein n=1 Tax=uncultured Jatrophihabitans sp. TaxID=1610747 RepID=UPI0035C951A1